MKTPLTWLSRTRARVGRLQRGSILLLTLFIAFGLSLMIGVLLQATVTQERLNRRTVLSLEAKDAVESATEYVISQLKLSFDNYPYITGNYFVQNPITIPTSISNWMWNGTDVSPSNVTVAVALVPNSTPIFIDPTNPANDFDPDVGRTVAATDVYVYASATAQNQFGTTTAYGEQALEVRNSPLFTNAVFYTMAMEFFPGPNMTISGPVHTNGDLWVAAEDGLTFSSPVSATGNFHVGFMPWASNWSGNESGYDGHVVYFPNGTVNGSTTPLRSGVSSSNYDSNTSYWDSAQTNYTGQSYTTWRQMAAHLWDGNLQDSANEVPDEQVTGYNDMLYHINGTSQNLNYAYAMIEPVQPSSYPNGTANPFNLGAGEAQKFETQSGLIVKVLATGAANITTSTVVAGNITGSGTTNTTAIANNTSVNEGFINTTVAGIYSSGSVTAATTTGNTTMSISGNLVLANSSTTTFSGTSGTIQANPVASTNASAFALVNQFQNNSTIPANVTGKNLTQNTLMEATTASYSSSTHNTTITTTRYVGMAYVEMDAVQSTVNSTTNALQPVYKAGTAITDSSGVVTYPGDVVEQPLTVNSSMITGAYNATTGAITNGALQGMLTFSPAIGNMTNQSSYSGNLNDIWGGMYDNRRQAAVSMVNLDVGALKAVVDNNATGYTANATAFFNGTGNASFNPANQYNGVVYVEFPSEPGNVSRTNSITANVTANGSVNGTTYPGDSVIDSVGAGNTTYGVAMGLGIVNATSNSTSTGVPNPTYTSSTIGQAGRVNGFTLATNNAMYLYGNYNADGNLNTPESNTTADTLYNSTMPDVPSNPDPSCCLAADCVTALSGSWSNRGSKTAAPTVASAGAVEINTAIITGIAPTSGNTLSGGVNNYPRFLENWTNNSVVCRYRGSMVCLFSSEIGNQGWSNSYFSAPVRQWGYYNQFKNGYYPPGTPNSRSYFRVNFSYITQSAYNSAVSGL
jgi:hypothetical protein